MQLVQEHWGSIAPVVGSLEDLEGFSLGVPCVVVGGGAAPTFTVLSDLPRVLRASAALSSGPMVRYLSRAAEVGSDAAWEEEANGDDGEEFCSQWDQAQLDVAAGARCSINDVVEMVVTARRGFLSTPRQLLVVLVRDKSTDITLVS